MLSIVVPTYNEAENIAELLTRIRSSLKDFGDGYEVIIIDDSSVDGTADLAERVGRELGIPVRVVVRRGVRGLASAVARGFKEARGDFILVMDADLQHPPEKIGEMLSRAIKENLDLVIASRYIGGGGVEGWGFHRRLLSRLASMAARILIPRARGIRDPLSGFFLVRRSSIMNMDLDSIERRGRGFKILLEILVRGSIERVAEHPYIFSPRRRGRSKLGLVESIEFIKQVMELSEYRLPKFMLVGLSGVLVNNLVLYILTAHLQIPVYISSLAAIEIATINNFTLNERWTFKRFREIGGWIFRLVKYHAAVGIGNLVNYITVLTLHSFIGVITSNIFGIGLGFITNYLVSSEFVWEVAKNSSRRET